MRRIENITYRHKQTCNSLEVMILLYRLSFNSKLACLSYQSIPSESEINPSTYHDSDSIKGVFIMFQYKRYFERINLRKLKIDLFQAFKNYSKQTHIIWSSDRSRNILNIGVTWEGSAGPYEAVLRYN